MRKKKGKLASPLTRRSTEEEEGSNGQREWEEIIPGGVYISELGYGYGAPVYGNAGSSDQSASKLLKYHRPLPTSLRNSLRRSLISF